MLPTPASLPFIFHNCFKLSFYCGHPHVQPILPPASRVTQFPETCVISLSVLPNAMYTITAHKQEYERTATGEPVIDLKFYHNADLLRQTAVLSARITMTARTDEQVLVELLPVTCSVEFQEGDRSGNKLKVLRIHSLMNNKQFDISKAYPQERNVGRKTSQYSLNVKCWNSGIMESFPILPDIQIVDTLEWNSNQSAVPVPIRSIPNLPTIPTLPTQQSQTSKPTARRAILTNLVPSLSPPPSLSPFPTISHLPSLLPIPLPRPVNTKQTQNSFSPPPPSTSPSPSLNPSTSPFHSTSTSPLLPLSHYPSTSTSPLLPHSPFPSTSTSPHPPPSPCPSPSVLPPLPIKENQTKKNSIGIPESIDVSSDETTEEDPDEIQADSDRNSKDESDIILSSGGVPDATSDKMEIEKEGGEEEEEQPKSETKAESSKVENLPVGTKKRKSDNRKSEKLCEYIMAVILSEDDDSDEIPIINANVDVK